MDEQGAIALLKGCQSLAERIIAEGPNLPLNTLTNADRIALEDFETVRAVTEYSELQRLGRAAGLTAEVIPILERMYNRIRTEGDPQGTARAIDTYENLPEGQSKVNALPYSTLTPEDH